MKSVLFSFILLACPGGNGDNLKEWRKYEKEDFSYAPAGAVYLPKKEDEYSIFVFAPKPWNGEKIKHNGREYIFQSDGNVIDDWGVIYRSRDFFTCEGSPSHLVIFSRKKPASRK